MSLRNSKSRGVRARFVYYDPNGIGVAAIPRVVMTDLVLFECDLNPHLPTDNLVFQGQKSENFVR
jgi:hypothetical protein